jgi:predicted nuclease of restriction endonuclease-like (RecB) superfamily
MIIDGEDHYLDLLFYSRAIRRLIAVELKIGPFKAAYKGYVQRGVMLVSVGGWLVAA